MLVAHLNHRDPVAAGDAAGNLLAFGFDLLRRLDRIIGVFRAYDLDDLGDEALGAAQHGIASILLVRLAQEPLRQAFERDALLASPAGFACCSFGFAPLVALDKPGLQAVSFGLDDFRWRVFSTVSPCAAAARNAAFLNVSR